MAGTRQTLKKLAKKYGLNIEGATYTKVIQEIISENVARASKKMGDLSNRRMKQAFADSIKNGIIDLPNYAITNLTVRKSADDGKMITDTLRDNLTRGLRKAITDNPNDTEKAIEQMQSHVRDTFNNYTTSHAKMIAVTEVRSSVDLSKAEYVRELIVRNPNKLKVTKKWIHHDHLVKVPRPTHKAIDGEKVLFDQPFSIGLMYPHDPNAPASEVIGCQCGYQVEVEELATNEIYKELKANINRFGEIRVYKASASINPATGKPYQIGETKVRPDGSKWVKTGTYSWAKAGTKDAEEAEQKVDPDNDNKKERVEIEGQSSKDAEDILNVYGEKGLYQLTRAGLYNLLLTHGVEDPKSMKWAEKVDKVKEIAKEIQEKGVTIKTRGREEFTSEDYHILHNTDLVGNVSTLEGQNIHTRNGDVKLEFTKDGKLSDKTYDELMQKVDPIQGGHWGSAETTNSTALAVALVNAPDWKPINKMQNGMLTKYDQQLSDYNYMSSLIRGIGLRKHAQEALKNPDMSRKNVPNFFRGMTVDASQYEQILAGEVDTIELTGCTAVSSFEAVADQYASSSWTKSFGAGRRSIKLVIERDDYMDNSIGMFHHNTRGYGHGNKNLGFELLTGSPSFYIKSVQQGKGFDVNKSADSFKNKIAYHKSAKQAYNHIKDVDLVDMYNNSPIHKYVIDLGNGSVISSYKYANVKHSIAKIKARAEVQDLNDRIADWGRQYYKDHIQDFFSKIKNGNIAHKNNEELRDEWNKDVRNAWEKSDLHKECSNIYDNSLPWLNTDNLSSLSLPSESDRKDIDNFFNEPTVMNTLKKEALADVVNTLTSSYQLQDLYDDWKQGQSTDTGSLTMRMFLDKKKPLLKSYKTQADKISKEYEDYKGFYDWKKALAKDANKNFLQTCESAIPQIKQEYKLTDDEINSIFKRDGEGNIVNVDPWNVDAVKLRNSLLSLMRNVPIMQGDDPIISDSIDDNPLISAELKSSPYATKINDYSDRRWVQLVDTQKRYKNAKREAELIDKYDVYNTPKSEIDAKAQKARQNYTDAMSDVQNYVLGEFKKNKNLDNSMSEHTINARYGDEIADFEKDLGRTDSQYQKLLESRNKAKDLDDDLTTISRVYEEYIDKVSDMHKNARPLEVHVVCGRGKKSMTAGADDQLEEQENDDGQ